MTQPNSVFCFGLGYTATFFANLLVSKNFTVAGTVRDDKKYENFKDSKINAYYYSDIVYEPEKIYDYEHFVISIPPQNGKDIVIEDFKKYLLEHPGIKSITYLSSTAVYGDHDGEWVDETAELAATSERGVERIAAENEWLKLKKNLKVNIFRLAGIYGADRNNVNQIAKGLTKYNIYKENSLFSRIHVADIFSSWIATIKNNVFGEIFNLSDDMPAASYEVNDYICDCLKIERLPRMNIDDALITDTLRGFYLDNKKVSNRKLKEKLGIELKFPTYVEGYGNIVSTLFPENN